MNMLLDLDRKEVESVELSSQRAYWQKQLAGDWPMLTFLMKDLPEDALAEFATTSFSIPDDIVAALDSFAEANGVTGFSTLLATYFVLLARYAAQDEVVVGIPVFAMDTAVAC